MPTPTDALCPVCKGKDDRCIRMHHPRPAAARVLEEIARTHTGFQCLDERRNDGCDFREVSVWGIRAALEAAFEAGASAAREKHDHALACLGTLLLALEHERAQNGEPVARPSEGWMREARIALDKARSK